MSCKKDNNPYDIEYREYEGPRVDNFVRGVRRTLLRQDIVPQMMLHDVNRFKKLPTQILNRFQNIPFASNPLVLLPLSSRSGLCLLRQVRRFGILVPDWLRPLIFFFRRGPFNLIGASALGDGPLRAHDLCLNDLILVDKGDMPGALPAQIPILYCLLQVI